MLVLRRKQLHKVVKMT